MLARQLRNPLLVLLLGAALTSFFVDERLDALIIFHIEVFFTDKTGTLTEGRISFAAALDAHGQPSGDVLRGGLLCNDAVLQDGQVVGGNPLDQALWEAPAASEGQPAAYRRLATRAFDYERRLASVLVEAPDGTRQVIVKGAPETVLARCRPVEPEARSVLEAQFAAGSGVIAVATRPADGQEMLRPEDETKLELSGFLTFLDRPKKDAAALRLTREIGGAQALAEWRMDEVQPGPSVRTEAQERDYLRRSTGSYSHPVGTCRLGSDERAVTDLELRVRGIDGLRVADASVMPSIPGANTNATVLAIAERAAAVIAGHDRASKTQQFPARTPENASR